MSTRDHWIHSWGHWILLLGTTGWIHSWVHWDPLLEAIMMLFQASSCTPEDQDEVQV